MKKKIVTTIVLFAIATVAAFNVNVNLEQDNNMTTLIFRNVEALAQFEFNNQDWDNDSHWYNELGGSWTPYLHSCTVTISTGGSVEVEVLGTGGGGSWVGNSTTYSGTMVTCVSGDGNCFNGTSCTPI